ncbi:MAG: hypothetical protein HYV26_24060 [Candidatus Hydrogenedentes bacterium]|nr:hypothetical protein [Candidatus Hydrogenedentota bacterium]MBI3117586.1 hypothetical protein [Candidatus Hydrogenedentota bacterium]
MIHAMVSLLLMPALVAQPLRDVLPGGSSQALPPGSSSELVEVVGVQARQTGQPSSDPSLKPYAGTLKKLPYDTFSQIYQFEQPAPYDTRVQFPLGDDYQTHVTLRSSAEQNAVGVAIEIETKDGGQALNAVEASGTAVRGKPLIFRGLELSEGELIVLVTIKQPDQDQSQQQNQGGQQGAQEEQEEQQKQQEPQEQNQEQEAQSQDQEQQEDAQQNESQQPSEEQLQNIEAILQSLREIDRKEQKQSQNRRERVIVSGDWW